MICLHTRDSIVYVAPGNVARIDPAGASGHWHGTMAYVRLFDGGVIECTESADEVAAAVRRATLTVSGGE